MRRVLVRYKLRPDRVAEHEGLLQRVFEQLRATRPAGLRYEAMRLADGVSFVHVAFVSVADNPLLTLAAFKEFNADIKSRCEEPPSSSEVTLFGAYSTPRDAPT